MPPSEVHLWLVLPFVTLLLLIATMPLLASHWWERNYPKAALLLGAVVVGYYFLRLPESHRPQETIHEYVSFICLIGSLFVVSGGIQINVKGESTPFTNVLFLAFGALLSNLVGTTGASMLLIRPYLRANKYRLTAFHVVFFIFIVSNVGGSLTPIGDPPLYLGYLKGIPFFWTAQNLFWIWLLGIVWLLAIFYILDRANFIRAPKEVRDKETAHETWKLRGRGNFLWLGVILAALFIQKPFLLRESLMVGAAICSWRFTQREIHQANDFSWAPLTEVVILFAGIFATMMPALDWLENHAGELGIIQASHFYWGSGCLSAALDNAPTYLNFLSAALGLFAGENPTIDTPSQIAQLLVSHPNHVRAISIGAVFFGAFTYIGNGPNFMVKSIVQHSGAKMPSFFGYLLRFSLPVLLPLFVLIWVLFFS